MDIKTLASYVGALTLIIGAIYSADKHFMTASAGESMKQEQRLTTLQIQLDLAREKLARLTAKENPTKDELNEIEFTRAMIIKLQEEALKKK